MITHTQDTRQDFRIDQFAAGLDGEAPDAKTLGWFEAVSFGFHDKKPDPADIAAYAKAYGADRRVLWGAYDDSPRPGVWDTRVPVATYATMVNTLNVGGGRLMDTHLITAVTVRATHRRRGLLRRMITDDLKQAADRGLAMAALTASEATIYGRFGFGAATFTREVEIDVRERFGLRAPATGTMELADPASLQKLAPELFNRFHARVPGSIGRQASYALRVSGRWSQDSASEDKALRTAVHYDGEGRPDGYVSYRFAGWDNRPYTVKVMDLVAAGQDAYLELWRYLGSLDLVERIQFTLSPEQDPLAWGLTDSRGYEVKAMEDGLWLRVLDPVAVLQTRPYVHDGGCTLRISDPLGICGGAYRLTVKAGRGTVDRLAADADVDAVVPVDSLGSLFLGGVRARTLAAAGHFSGASADTVDRLDSLFATDTAPYCITHF
ncbi:MAG TPA: GNAT family N-acetyltransferase [Arthrobacter sp.]|nr:GNAT family N-acetyltransferase [Arthrobacter sp.]